MNSFLNGIAEIAKQLKGVLEKHFGLVYIEKKLDSKNEENNATNKDLLIFEIPKNKESIFLKITSINKLSEIKIELKENYKTFSNDFSDYFDRVEKQLNEKERESFEIIDKTIKNRGKKFNSAIDKFRIEDDWNISKIQEEFYFQLQKNLKDIIESLIQPISTGLSENTAYEWIIKDFNKFLSNIGIYTKKVEINEKTDNELLEPLPCDDCETSDKNKKEIIKEVVSYPYILNNNNKFQIVVEGKVILWKIKHT